MCQRGDKVGGTAEESQEMSNLRSYVVAVSSSQSEDSEDSDVELVRQERKKMLKRPKTTTAEIHGDRASSNGRNETNADSSKSSDKSSGLVRVKKCVVRSKGNGSSCSHQSDTDRYVSAAVANNKQDFGNLRSIILLLALGIHSLFEGIAVGLQDEFWSLVNLIIGITMHSCLMSFALGISIARLTSSESSRVSQICKIAAAFSAAMPIGTGIGMAVETLRTGHGFVSSLVSAILQALTAGTFIYVIFFDVLARPEMERGREGLVKILVTFIGFIIVCALRFVIAV